MNLICLLDYERVATDEGEHALIAGARAAHLLRVLKVEVGQRLRVALPRESVGQGEVVEVGSGEVRLRLLAMEPVEPPPIRVILALPRPKALRRILQTAASFGVEHIDLVNGWKVDKSYWSSPNLESAALARELHLGCEQGRQPWLPSIACHRLLRPLFDELAEAPTDEERARLIAHPDAPQRMDGAGKASTLSLAIGPEGGWVERELTSFSQCGFEPVALGGAILRSEIALAAALSQWQLVRAMQDAPTS